jgi:hypothetical protein
MAYRRDAAAVGLSSGGVLVVGNGEASDGFTVPTSAELWDPAARRWTETGSLNKVRSDFALVPLSDDRALVAGGLNAESPAQSYSSAYIFDAHAGAGTWSKAGVMSVARTGPSAAVLPDGRVLVAGGFFFVQPDDATGPVVDLAGYRVRAGDHESRSGPRLFDIDMPPAGAAIATAALFDPATGLWTTTGPMHYARYDAPAVTLADGRVLIVGTRSQMGDGFGYGVEVADGAFETAEIYDPKTGTFALTKPFPPIDRQALAANGQPGANPMPEDDGEPLNPGTLVATADGGAVLIGQTRWWKHLADMTRSFRLDAVTGTWSEIGKTWVFVGEPTAVPLTSPGARNVAGALVAALGDGRILVAGGAASVNGFSSDVSDVTELYDPVADTWTGVAALPAGRSGGMAVSLMDGSVLVIGGLPDNGEEGGNLTATIRYVP